MPGHVKDEFEHTLNPDACNHAAALLAGQDTGTFRFSVNLFLSTIICCLLALEVVLYAQYHNGLIRSTVQSFWHHFLPEEQERGVAIFSDVEQTLQFLEHTTLQYHRIAEVVPGVFRHCLSSHCTVHAPQIQVWHLNEKRKEEATLPCPLTIENPTGPFGRKRQDRDAIPNLSKNAVRFAVSFDIITTPPWVELPGYEPMLKCFHWQLVQVYELSHDTGRCSVQLHWDYEECTGHIVKTQRHLTLWLLLILLSTLFLCSFVDLILRIYTFGIRGGSSAKRLLQFVWSVMPMKGDGSKCAPSFLLQTSTGWLLWGMMADVLTVCFSIVFYCMLAGMPHTTLLRWLLLGLSSLTQFINLCSFLQHDPRLFLLFNTLSSAAPILGAFLLSALPLFMSFALFGTAVFGMHSAMFETLAQAMATLFAIVNGDSIVAAFSSTEDGNTGVVAFLSKVYFFAFILLVLYVVANVARVIIVQAYNHVSANSLMMDLSNYEPLSASVDGINYPYPSPSLQCPAPSYLEYCNRMKVIRVTLTLALCALFTIQVAYNAAGQNRRIFETETKLKTLFLPSEEVSEFSSFTAYLYAFEDSVDHIEGMVDQYYRLAASSPVFYEHDVAADGSIAPPILELEYLSGGPLLPFENLNTATQVIHCPLFLHAPAGPLRSHAHSDDPCHHVPDIRSRIVKAAVSVAFWTHPQSSYRSCIEWKVVVTHDFSERTGVIPVTIKLAFISCAVNSISELLFYPRLWLSGPILLVTLCKIVLNAKSSYRKALERSWRRYRLFTMTANMIWITENALYICVLKEPSESLVDLHRVLLGVVCCLNWILVVGHLESQPAHRYLGLTLRRALPIASSFVLGALPVFLGYCMLGTVFFGHICSRFATLQHSAVTLFGILNGDVVLDVYTFLNDANSPFLNVLSSAFLYTFIPLMIYGMLNIFLVITEEAYRSVAHDIDHPSSELLSQ